MQEPVGLEQIRTSWCIAPAGEPAGWDKSRDWRAKGSGYHPETWEREEERQSKPAEERKRHKQKAPQGRARQGKQDVPEEAGGEKCHRRRSPFRETKGRGTRERIPHF